MSIDAYVCMYDMCISVYICTYMQAQWAAAKAEEVKRFAKSVELRAWLVPELRALCEVRGLRKTGRKAELVARLCDELCKPEPAAKRPRTGLPVHMF